MKTKIYNNRKLITLIGILFLIIGTVMAIKNWGTEPEETISGVLCGFGFTVTLISFSIKKPI